MATTVKTNHDNENKKNIGKIVAGAAVVAGGIAAAVVLQKNKKKVTKVAKDLKEKATDKMEEIERKMGDGKKTSEKK